MAVDTGDAFLYMDGMVIREWLLRRSLHSNQPENGHGDQQNHDDSGYHP
jgi:hypothetical protein